MFGKLVTKPSEFPLTESRYQCACSVPLRPCLHDRGCASLLARLRLLPLFPQARSGQIGHPDGIRPPTVGTQIHDGPSAVRSSH